jgi:hypothetical protein
MQAPIGYAMRACIVLCALLLLTRMASAHGFVGDRFFPPTIATDDPFAVDELALPTLSTVRNPSADSEPANWQTSVGFEFDKEILPHFALGVSDNYNIITPDRGRNTLGWDNLTLTAKYELWWNAPHEAIISVGLESEIGGTGSRSAGRDSFSTFGPAVYFGKGFGDLPDSLDMLKPLAVTGVLQQDFPTESVESNSLEWGFAIEYSLPYLQQHVKDIGLREPFNNLIPLVEFAFETGENRDDRGITTGTINPGVLWETPWFQLGVEANVPVNSRSGTHVGATLQMWIYIDDLFPKVFGHPVFGERS